MGHKLQIMKNAQVCLLLTLKGLTFSSMREQFSGERWEVLPWDLYLSSLRLKRGPWVYVGSNLQYRKIPVYPRHTGALTLGCHPAFQGGYHLLWTKRGPFRTLSGSCHQLRTQSSEKWLRCFAGVGWPVMFFVGLMLLLLWCSLCQQGLT